MPQPVILNKIDPVIINNVQQQTVEGVVHTSDKIRVSKDKNQEKDKKYQKKYIKDKLDRLNSILRTKGIDAEFKIDGDYIVALNKDGEIIRRYEEDEFDKLFSNMEDLNGLFIDMKK